jgi:multisubunit Na+/H+ antiporter MnhC subunit
LGGFELINKISLFLVLAGVVLVVAAVVLVAYNFGVTREQIAENVSLISILSDNFVRYAVAMILTAIGVILTFLGVKR